MPADRTSHIKAVFRAIEFTEQHLKEDIAVADMADAAYYSHFHFCRVFNNIVHQTPYDYLIKRRLTEAAGELLSTNKKIIEIAFEYLFNNPETFSRAFKRFFDMQPVQWKKNASRSPDYGFPKLGRDYLKHINKGDYLKPVVEKKSQLNLAGLMGIVKKEKDIAELWRLLASELEQNDSLESVQNYYGILTQITPGQSSTSFYFASAEMESNAIQSPALVFKTFPETTWARFVHKGTRRDRKWTSDYIRHTWLPKACGNVPLLFEMECLGKKMNPVLSAESETAIFVPMREGFEKENI